MKCPVCDQSDTTVTGYGSNRSECRSCGHVYSNWDADIPRHLIEGWIGDILRAREAWRAKQNGDSQVNNETLVARVEALETALREIAFPKEVRMRTGVSEQYMLGWHDGVGPIQSLARRALEAKQ